MRGIFEIDNSGWGCFVQKRGGGQEVKMPFLFWRFFALLTGRGWVAAIYPAGGDPSAPAHPDGLHITGSRAGRARTRADKYQGIPPPKRWTRCTGLRSIPDRPRGQIVTAAGRWRAWSVSETVQIWTTQSYHFVPEKQIRKILYFCSKGIDI